MDTGTRAKTLDEFERDEAEAADGGKKGKAPKPAKAPKSPKKKKKKVSKKDGKGETKTGEGKPAREKRHHPVRNTLLLTSLFWLLPIALMIVVCRGYHDEYGDYKYLADQDGYIRGPILSFLNPEDGGRDEYYSAELEEINSTQQEWDDKLAELDAREAELDAREEELGDWESRLQDQEDALEEGLPSGDGETVPVTADIAALAKAWGEMTPANAAAAIGEMSDDAVTLKVLRLVKYKSLGKILDAMSAEEAARISELLAVPPDEE